MGADGFKFCAAIDFIIGHADVGGKCTIGSDGDQIQIVVKRGGLGHEVANFNAVVEVAVKAGVEQGGDAVVIGVIGCGVAEAVFQIVTVV